MPDNFSRHQSGLTSPARDAAAITPSDATALPTPIRGIYVGSPGALRVRMLSGGIVTFTGVLGGAVYPFRVVQVMATGTTAGGIVGLS